MTKVHQKMTRKYITKALWKLPPSIRDFFRSFKRFHLIDKKRPKKQLFIVFIDGTSFHGGLTDRLKGIISTFSYCLNQKIDFRIKHNFPFDLSDFLKTGKYNWQIQDNEVVSYNIFESKYLYLIGDPNINRLIKLNTKRQIHCLANRDILEKLNQTQKTKYRWGELFNILFKPTMELRALLDSYKFKIGKNYKAAVFRFQNLLGDFTEYNDVDEQNEENKALLVSKCTNSLIELQKSLNTIPILVTSDSKYFLEIVAKIPGLHAFPSEVVHIDNSFNGSKAVYMKTFVDLFLLAESDEIVSIGTKEMYKTEFPLYAAKINNIPFRRIIIE